MSHLNTAIAIVGGQTKLANKLGTSQSNIYNWKIRDRVPAKYIRILSKLTNHTIAIEDLLRDHEQQCKNKNH